MDPDLAYLGTDFPLDLMVALEKSDGWEIWKDTATQSHYYFHRPTDECRWDKPAQLLELVLEDHGIWEKKVDPQANREYYYNKDSLQCTWEPVTALAGEYSNPENEMKSECVEKGQLIDVNVRKSANEATAPTGKDVWVPLDDPETGNTYYYNIEIGMSSWGRRQADPAQHSAAEIIDSEEDDWKVYKDEVSGCPYYFNKSTNTASWEKPDLRYWEEYTDPDTKSKYYYHKVCKITQWSKPKGWLKAIKPQNPLNTSDEAATIISDQSGEEKKDSAPIGMVGFRPIGDNARLLSLTLGEDNDDDKNEMDVNTRTGPTSKHEKNANEAVEPHEFEDPPRPTHANEGDVNESAVTEASWPCTLRTTGALFVKCDSNCHGGIWVQRFFRIEEGMQLVSYPSEEAAVPCYKIDLPSMELSLGSVCIERRTYFCLSMSKSSTRQEEVPQDTYHFRAPDEPRMWEWVVSLSIAIKPGISTLPLTISWETGMLRLTEQILKFLSVRQALSQREVEIQVARELVKNTENFERAGSSWMLLKTANLGAAKCSLVSQINDRKILQIPYQDSLNYLLGCCLNEPLIRLKLRPFPDVKFSSLYKVLQPKGSNCSHWLQGRFELRDGALHYEALSSLNLLDLKDAQVSLVPSANPSFFLPADNGSGKQQEVYMVISDRKSTHLVLNLPSFHELIIWGKEILLGITIMSGGDKDLSMAFDSAGLQRDCFKDMEREMDESLTWTGELTLNEDSDITVLVSKVSQLLSGIDGSDPDGLGIVVARLRETNAQVTDTTFRAMSKLRSSMEPLSPQKSPDGSPRSLKSQPKKEGDGQDDLSRYKKLVGYLANNPKSLVNIAWGLPCKIRDAFFEIVVHCILSRYNDRGETVISIMREAVSKNKATGGHGLRVEHIQKLMRHRPVAKDGADPSPDNILHALVLSMLSRAEISGYMKLLVAPSLEWLSFELSQYSQVPGDSTPIESLAFTLVQQILFRLIDPEESLKPPPVLLGIYEMLRKEGQVSEKFFCDVLLLPLLTQAIGSGELYHGIDVYKPNFRRLDPLHLLPQKAQIDPKLFGRDLQHFSSLVRKYVDLIISPNLVVDDFSLRRRAAVANLQVMMKGFIQNVLKDPKVDATMPHDPSPFSCVLLRSEIQVLHMSAYFHICHCSGQGEEQTPLREILQGLHSPFERMRKGNHDEPVVFTIEAPEGKMGKWECADDLKNVIKTAKVLVAKLQGPLYKRERWRMEKEGKKVLLSILKIETQILEAVKGSYRLRSKEQLLQVYKAQLELFIEAFPLVYYTKSNMDTEANKQFELGKTLITKRYSDLFTRETKLIP